MAVRNYPEGRTPKRIRRNGVDDVAIRLLLRQRVDWWLSTNQGLSFKAKNLIGGEYRDWHHWPELQALYDYHVARHSRDPYVSAAIDAGWMLLEALYRDDPRTFWTDGGFRRSYRLV